MAEKIDVNEAVLLKQNHDKIIEGIIQTVNGSIGILQLTSNKSKEYQDYLSNVATLTKKGEELVTEAKKFCHFSSEFMIELIKNSAAKATNKQKAVEQKADKQKVVEQKSVEQKPVEQKPVEQKPVEQKPVEQKPVEQKPDKQKKSKKKSEHKSKKKHKSHKSRSRKRKHAEIEETGGGTCEGKYVTDTKDKKAGEICGNPKAPHKVEDETGVHYYCGRHDPNKKKYERAGGKQASKKQKHTCVGIYTRSGKNHSKGDVCGKQASHEVAGSYYCGLHKKIAEEENASGEKGETKQKKRKGNVVMEEDEESTQTEMNVEEQESEAEAEATEDYDDSSSDSDEDTDDEKNKEMMTEVVNIKSSIAKKSLQQME